MKMIILVGILLLLLGCVGENQTITNGIIDDSILKEKQTLKEEKNPDFRNYALFDQYANEHGLSLEKTKELFRTFQNIQKEKDIFAKLPKPNNSFAEDRKKLLSGNGFDLESISYQNYLQPEFYLNFDTIGIRKWIENAGKNEKVVGIAATPADQQVIMEKGQTDFHTNLFVGGTWGATYYQGIGLTYKVTPKTDINITISPNETIIGPTFPTFDPQWIKRIRISGKIGKDVPKGNYTIKIDTKPADIETQLAWSQQYNPYAGVNELIKNPQGIATLQIQIK